MTHAITVSCILEATFGLDGGAMFGIIPKPLWERTNPADGGNRITLGTRCLLIEHPSAGRILVDTGIGEKWDEKSRKIYKIAPTEGEGERSGIEAALAGAGLTVDDIDHVVLTHLHFDHAGGVSRFAEDGETVVATFPKATHHLLRENWSWANAPSERDGGSYRPVDFRLFEDDPSAPKLNLVDGLCELFPGVTLIPRRGHTPGMACVLVEAEDATYCHMADLIPTSGHLRIPYVMGYDLNPVTTCQEKREILSEAARHGWKLVFVHDPTLPWCRVEPDGRGQYRRVQDDD